MAGLVMLPPLRQDLALHAGPDAPDGSPTWTLHDPACNRFYQLSWPAFELLSRWGLGTAEAVLAAVRRETTLQLDEADLGGVLRMLAGNHLLTAATAQDSANLLARAQALRPSPAQWLLKNYLSLRIPLVRPMRWLQRCSPYVAWAYRPQFWLAVVLTAAVGAALAARRWDEFVHTFVSYASLDGLLAIGVALSVAKVLHELGHAFTATRYGCRVPTMGVALLVMLPVLYTDTSEAWKLTSRRQRLAIGSAGMLSELALASVALLAWSLLPDTPGWAPVRSGAFLLATSTWVLTLAINASPFMRFDGYFLLSDAVNTPNLHERAFAIARWWLRERLFGWGDPAPEPMSQARRRGMVAFSAVTWLYRLGLFLGIALLVFHAFFKALGALLMSVELGWFIVMPIVGELAVWWRRRASMRWNRATRRSAVVGFGLLLAVLWPWQSTVHVPGMLGALQAQALYAPVAAQVVGPMPRIGQQVRAGEPLLRLQAPQLQEQLAMARAKADELRWQLDQQAFDEQLREAGVALQRRWESASAQVQGLQQQIDRLTLRAPFDGTVAEVDDDASQQGWVSAGEPLLELVAPYGSKADVYLDEETIAQLRVGETATFVPAQTEAPRVRCRVARTDAAPMAALDAPGLASVHGGPIPAKQLPDGRVVPLQPTFHARLDHCDLVRSPARELPGTALLSSSRRSLAQRALARALAIWHQEAAL